MIYSRQCDYKNFLSTGKKTRMTRRIQKIYYLKTYKFDEWCATLRVQIIWSSYGLPSFVLLVSPYPMKSLYRVKMKGWKGKSAGVSLLEPLWKRTPPRLSRRRYSLISCLVCSSSDCMQHCSYRSIARNVTVVKAEAGAGNVSIFLLSTTIALTKWQGKRKRESERMDG